MKVGDTVRILRNNGYSGLYVGTYAIVKSIGELTGGIYVTGDGDPSKEWCYFESDLELVSVSSPKSILNDPDACPMMGLDEMLTKEFKMHYLLTKGSITLHYEGKTVVIAKDDERFGLVLEAIREKRLSDIPTIVEPKKFFESQGLEYEDGVIKARGEEMPSELADRIAGYKEHNLPFDSLLKFWDNLKLNPSFNSRKQLFKFLENKGHSLTEDGCFVGYRGVTEDFKDKHSGKFDNRPGQTCQVDRKDVDDNPNNTCSFGLHVGGYQYAKDFGSGGKLVLVKVNPADVVAVPNDYDGQKMRVCKFEVIEEVKDMNKELIFNSGIEDSDLPEDDYSIHDDEENEDQINDHDVDAVLNARDSILDEAGTDLVNKIAQDCPWLTNDQIQEILDNE